MGAAVGEEKNSVEAGKNMTEKEVDMILAKEEEKIPAGQITTSASMLDGKDQQQLAGSEKMQLGGSEKMQLCSSERMQFGDPEKTQLGGSEQTHSLAVTEEKDESKKVQLQNKKLKKRKRSELPKIKKEESCDAEEPASEPSFLSTWSASYYTKILQHEKPSYKGSILVDPKVNCLSLLDDEETVVDTRKLEEGELIYPGLELEFPCHIAQIDMHILQAEGDDRGVDNEKQPSSKRYKKDRIDEKKRNKMKRNRSVENWERAKELRRKTMRSPQAKLLGSSMGMFARVASLRKELSPAS